MIISTNIGGLSNRIKSLVSCLRYSYKNNIEAKVYWKVLNSYKTHTHILNCSFNKLFLNKIEIKKINKTMNIFNSHCLMIFEEDNLPINFNNFNSKCSKKFSRSDKLNRNIDFMYNKIPKKIKKDYIKCFKVLEPIGKLQQKIDRYSKQFNDKTVSVHIRSWNRNGEKSRRDY